MTATLQLARQIGWARKSWPISIDGSFVGGIGPGETVELPIDPGRHVLRLGALRNRSPERSFHVDDNEVVTFRCHSRYTLVANLIGLLWPNSRIFLRQDGRGRFLLSQTWLGHAAKP